MDWLSEQYATSQLGTEWVKIPWGWLIVCGMCFWAGSIFYDFFLPDSVLKGWWQGGRRSKRWAVLAEQVSVFVLQHEMSRPSPNDFLNYASPSIRNRAQFGDEASRGLAIGQDYNEFELRSVLILHEQQKNHEKKFISEYESKFSGKMYSALKECKDLGLLNTDDEIAIFRSTLNPGFGKAFEIVKEQENLLRACLEQIGGNSE